uniref:Uncharacterized protein n=1 Tax=Rhizophora mucronata TaxID=61149 RepID=A0A2P2P533_RHIMU
MSLSKIDLTTPRKVKQCKKQKCITQPEILSTMWGNANHVLKYAR